MDVKHQEETDKGAEKYLKHVHKLHQTQREYLYKKATAGHLKDEPKREWFSGNFPKGTLKSIDRLLFMKTCLPLKIEIINTDANQLNFQHELK